MHRHQAPDQRAACGMQRGSRPGAAECCSWDARPGLVRQGRRTYVDLGVRDLAPQPWLRAGLAAFAEAVRGLGPVLDVGCGPGTVLGGVLGWWSLFHLSARGAGGRTGGLRHGARARRPGAHRHPRRRRRGDTHRGVRPRARVLDYAPVATRAAGGPARQRRPAGRGRDAVPSAAPVTSPSAARRPTPRLTPAVQINLHDPEHHRHRTSGNLPSAPCAVALLAG